MAQSTSLSVSSINFAIAAFFILPLPTLLPMEKTSPLVFLGVLAPHIAGFLSPAVARARLFLSALMGAILVLIADALTRGLGGSLPMPLGLSLTMVGVPLFIIALRLQALRKLQSH